MKVLVTGGAGFIGSHVVDSLLDSGFDVVVLDDLSTGTRSHIPSTVRLCQGDIRIKTTCRDVLRCERPHFVIHLAAQMNVRRSIKEPVTDAEINIVGTLNILQASAEMGVRRMILASSGGAVYGEQPHYPCREESLPRPSSPYGVAKLAAEHYGRALAGPAGMEFTALRLANVYGPRQRAEGGAGVVSLFLDVLAKGECGRIFGDGHQTRDFVWVGDVARAFEAALAGPPGTYNIGTGREVQILDLWKSLERISRLSSSIHYLPPIPGEVRRNVLAIEEAGNQLGWSPGVQLEEGLKRTVGVFLSERGRSGARVPMSGMIERGAPF